MNKRLELHEILRGIIGITEPNGDDHVYFQPPESVRMKYPAIVYSRERIDDRFADGIPYLQNTAYAVTVIDKDPDSEIVKKVSQLPMSRHNRHYKRDNLNHDVFTIYI